MSDVKPGRRPFRTATPELLRHVQEAYERGQMLEALRGAETLAPLREWGGSRGCVLAARLAMHAGAPRLALRLALRGRRADPLDPEAMAQYGYELLSRRGPLAAWKALRAWSDRGDIPAHARAELLALQGRVAVELRDFANAEALFAGAEAAGPGEPWVRLGRALLLEGQDRVEEALEVAREACALHPHPYYRPGMQMVAHLLQSLDRDDEAISLLQAAGAVLQSGPVAAHLHYLLAENGRWAEAEAALARFVALSPLLEEPGRRWVDAQRAHAAYRLGRRAEAATLAARLDDDFHRQFATRLAAAPTIPERVQLDVTFVRQHFKTCAPATLAALGRFWAMPAAHLEMVEAICYDGTPHWQQRGWAERNGWYVREFRVTRDCAVALLERGIPFAISVVETASAHMMAVTGFDRARDTLLFRDPSQPYVLERPAEEFLARSRALGPHGMVLLPLAERARLEGLTLPDAEVHDEYHRLSVCLAGHDRAGAAGILQHVESAFPDHPLAWDARLALASYDDNTGEKARCLDRLLEQFPDQPVRLLQRLACLRDAPREEQIRFLEQHCAAPGADAGLLIESARALAGDARCLPQAQRRLGRALRLRPLDAVALSVQADLYWAEGRLDEATEVYRFAANLEGFREDFYRSWFLACRRTRRTDEAVAHLRDRFTRFGRRSEQPALTLAWAWCEMEQPASAREVLTAARALRPDDGYLLLRSASLIASLGGVAEADELLEAAGGKVRESDRLRAAAEIAESRLDAAAALHQARELLRLEPLALDAHGVVARSLARLEGPAAALGHLEDACARFPHHCGLQRMRLEWSRHAGPAAAVGAGRDLLSLAPSDAWARRELALALSESRQHEAALQEASEAVCIEPRSSYSFSVRGYLHYRCGHLPEARAAYPRAVELSVDNRHALVVLLELAPTDQARRDELVFIEQQLIQQVVTGDGVLAFLELARPVLEPEALLESVRQAHRERPDLWHVWSALISHLGHLGRFQEARAMAEQATARFPHLPRTWLDLAAVHRWCHEPDEEIAAAQRAFDLNPAWTQSAIVLADSLERQDRLEDARRVYQRALQHCPGDAPLHGYHASLLWRQQQPEAALAAVEQALRLAPGYEWAWEQLQSWARECGRAERTQALARALTRERPGEPRVWLLLARALSDPAEGESRLAAIARALELDTRFTEAWDLKAEVLACAERFEEALLACRQGATACTSDGHILRGREAWVEAQRGQLPRAVHLMRSVLEENASFVWGWDQLAQWLAWQEALDEAATALERLLRLRPHDPWVHRRFGFLRLRQGDRAEARSAFAATLRLDPADASAAQALFDLHLQADDLGAAAATLQLMQTHQPGAATLAAAIRLHLRCGEQAAAIEALRGLCASVDPEPWPVEAAADAFERAGLSPSAVQVFRQALAAGSCQPQVAAAAVRLLLASRRPLTAVRLFAGLPSGEILRRAAGPLVHGLADGRGRLLLRWLLWRRRAVLAGDDPAWGQVGYALAKFRRMGQCVRWLADWRSRPDAEPWMLFNLCFALRHLDRYGEANAVARHVLASWPHREGAAALRLFLAVEEALAGSVPAAQEHLRQAAIRESEAYDQDLRALARALVAFRQSSPADRRRQFLAVRRELADRFPPGRMLRLGRDVRQTFRWAGKIFADEGGGWTARLWFAWRLYWPWLLALLAALVLLLDGLAHALG
jgi:tetratricopeptide (TPR) repeat protein